MILNLNNLKKNAIYHKILASCNSCNEYDISFRIFSRVQSEMKIIFRGNKIVRRKAKGSTRSLSIDRLKFERTAKWKSSNNASIIIYSDGWISFRKVSSDQWTNGKEKEKKSAFERFFD